MNCTLIPIHKSGFCFLDMAGLVVFMLACLAIVFGSPISKKEYLVRLMDP